MQNIIFIIPGGFAPKYFVCCEKKIERFWWAMAYLYQSGALDPSSESKTNSRIETWYLL